MALIRSCCNRWWEARASGVMGARQFGWRVPPAPSETRARGLYVLTVNNARACCSCGGGRFACRKCQKVAHTLQSEDMCGRMWRAQAKIETKLAENWQRPTGMRRHTYDRLSGALLACEERRDVALD